MSETTVKPRLKVSREGVLLIKSLEGFRSRATPRAEGGWVIGYGHTRSAREDAVVSEAEAELLLQYDLLPVVGAVNDRIAGPLNQHQFDALASFAFSIGVDRFIASDVVERINAGGSGDAAEALSRWPVRESAPPLALRRRAAERAMFMADPASAVTLADLLTAALPEPERPTAPASTPAPAPANDPEPVATAAPEATPIAAARNDARAQAVAALLGEAEAAPPAAVEPTPDDAPPIEAQSLPEAAPPVEALAADPVPPQEDAAPVRETSDAETRLALLRYSPYPTPFLGALPDFSADPSTGYTVNQAMSPAVSLPAADPAPPADAPIGEPPSEPAAPSTAPSSDALLVLTPLENADVLPAPRPVWPEALRHTSDDVEEAALFDEDEVLAAGYDPVLRHEALSLPEPRRFDWGETGAFVIMGGVGLVSFGAAMAAFRLSAEQSDPLSETAIIGWVLALIGATCVGVSAYNLYRRWGRLQDA